MTRFIAVLIAITALVASPVAAQTPPKPAPPTAKPAPPTAKPAAPTVKPAAPQASTVKPAAAPAMTAKAYGPGVYAHFVTSNGNFTIRLFDKDAPRTVENFVGLAEGKKQWKDAKTGRMIRRPYYNNVLFHRVIPGFMIQGGDPEGTGTGGPGYTFPDEISPNHRHDKPGIVSMANRGPNTNGGQFFITVAPYPSLDGKYSIFGEIVEGLEAVVGISKVPRSPQANRPTTPVVIKTVKIERVS